MIRDFLLWLLRTFPVPNEEELGHLALCAWNNWTPSEKTRATWNEIWVRDAPQSRRAWKRVARAIASAVNPDERAVTPEQELETTLAAVLRAIEEQNPVIRQGSFDLPFRNYEAVVKARELMKLRNTDRKTDR